MHYLINTIRDIEQDLSITLNCTELYEKDTVENACGYGDDVFYRSTPITVATAYASGFVWQHPNGGTISGNFGKPVEVASITFDERGNELDSTSGIRTLARAIRQKLGNVAEIDAEILALTAPAPDLTKLDWSFIKAIN